MLVSRFYDLESREFLHNNYYQTIFGSIEIFLYAKKVYLGVIKMPQVLGCQDF